jgi:hypothetical protein
MLKSLEAQLALAKERAETFCTLTRKSGPCERPKWQAWADEWLNEVKSLEQRVSVHRKHGGRDETDSSHLGFRNRREVLGLPRSETLPNGVRLPDARLQSQPKPQRVPADPLRNLTPFGPSNPSPAPFRPGHSGMLTGRTRRSQADIIRKFLECSRVYAKDGCCNSRCLRGPLRPNSGSWDECSFSRYTPEI